MPIVILAGTGDKIVDFQQQSGRLHDSVPQSDLLPIDGAGHMIHHLVPRQVVEAIDLPLRPPRDVFASSGRDPAQSVGSAAEPHASRKIA
jgi:hypothetical protein